MCQALDLEGSLSGRRVKTDIFLVKVYKAKSKKKLEEVGIKYEIQRTKMLSQLAHVWRELWVMSHVPAHPATFQPCWMLRPQLEPL